MTDKQPPFDGKPCPMCPVEIRGLSACVHNYLNAVRNGSEPERIARKFAQLERAAEVLEQLTDAHFANRMHSHGKV